MTARNCSAFRRESNRTNQFENPEDAAVFNYYCDDGVHARTGFNLQSIQQSTSSLRTIIILGRYRSSIFTRFSGCIFINHKLYTHGAAAAAAAGPLCILY